jgi:hypothetical protein
VAKLWRFTFPSTRERTSSQRVSVIEVISVVAVRRRSADVRSINPIGYKIQPESPDGARTAASLLHRDFNTCGKQGMGTMKEAAAWDVRNPEKVPYARGAYKAGKTARRIPFDSRAAGPLAFGVWPGAGRSPAPGDHR